MSKPKPKEKYEFEGYRISKEENDYLCALRKHLLAKQWLPAVGIGALFSLGSMATIVGYGRLRGIKYTKSIPRMWGVAGFVGGAALSLWDTKQYVQSRRILEDMPKSRLAFKVRHDISSIYESSIMSTEECLLDLEFKRPNYWQVNVPIITCIAGANLGYFTSYGFITPPVTIIRLLGALIVSYLAYEGFRYGVNRVRIAKLTYDINVKKKLLEEVQEELAKLQLEREQERVNEETNAKLKKETKLDKSEKKPLSSQAD